MKSKSRLKARSRKLVVSKNCKKMQMTRVKGVKSKRVNRAHARTGTCSCTGSKRGYVTQQRRSWTREEGLVFVRCEDTRKEVLSFECQCLCLSAIASRETVLTGVPSRARPPSLNPSVIEYFLQNFKNPPNFFDKLSKNFSSTIPYKYISELILHWTYIISVQ